MKRLALISAATPPQMNGVAVTLEKLINVLPALGWEVEVHVPDYATLACPPSVRVIRYRAFDVGIYPNIRYPRSLRPIAPGAEASKPQDILHVLTPGPWEFLLLTRLRGRSPRARSILSYLTDFAAIAHLLGNRPRLQALCRTLFRRFEHWFIGKVDAVHVINATRTAHLATGADKSRLVPLGVDGALVAKARANPMPLPRPVTGRQIAAAYLGRLSREKGTERLLDLLDWRPEIILFLLGDGPERRQLEALARLRGLSDRVVFLGERPQAEAFAYVASMDLLVQPSRSEEFGLAILEGVALGVPVISMADVLGPEDLRKSFPAHVLLMDRWCREELERALAHLGGRRPAPVDLGHWTWEAAGERFDRCYTEIMALQGQMSGSDRQPMAPSS